ncbi:tRNA lysidine(34) synthetase TilS [Methylocystis sp. Sn-Cys]|uniref:tRNA lysidine(34) synthetase TilS n=1 Tax=Methylocystis sp. Sn-Cys TaxID=1701263 RepID=UPI001AEDEFDE|nr:tRNA lysidine(34) synthetase TilS [Methylocystis sp. Sn-Cys]
MTLDKAAGAFALLAPYERLLLAVSGGPDSIALMLLCAQWPERASHEIAVATVDHGLRADARAEAEQVGEWARTLGFAHHLLSWEGEKPQTRIQERARAARYALLADCAKTVSAGAIVTAHHADDQAETILFRLTRGSGVSGLAGMAPRSNTHGAPLLRPLLGFTKSELVEICENAGHRFFSDPSNANEAYTRARLRKLMPLLAEQGLDRTALLRLGERAARAEAALASCAAAAHERALTETAPALAGFDAGALTALPLDILQRLLAREIARLAPQAQLRLDRLERAADRLSRALREKAPLRLTIADLLIESDGNNVTLRPAPPRRSA